MQYYAESGSVVRVDALVGCHEKMTVVHVNASLARKMQAIERLTHEYNQLNYAASLAQRQRAAAVFKDEDE